MKNKKIFNCQRGIRMRQIPSEIADTLSFFQWHAGASEVFVFNDSDLKGLSSLNFYPLFVTGGVCV